MSQRVFVAIKASQEVQEAASAWRQKFEHLPVRWIAMRNLHITLLPPWQEDDIEAARERLRSIAGQIEQFELVLRLVQFGPNRFRPHLVWAQGHVSHQLLELKDALERAFDMESVLRTVRFHLTLARFRSEDFSRFLIKQLNERINWRQAVESVVLMESECGHSGAEYEVLEEIALSAH